MLKIILYKLDAGLVEMSLQKSVIVHFFISSMLPEDRPAVNVIFVETYLNCTILHLEDICMM